MSATETVSAGQTPIGALKNADAARYLGIAPGTLANLRAAGDGPRHTKLGRTVVYRVIDLDAYLADRVVVGGSK